MEFDILGPLRVRNEAHEVRIDAHLQRVLLAVLLSRANRPVAVSVLRDALWGDCPPRSADKVLQVYVHRLRRALGERDRVTHSRSGYAVVVCPEELDTTRFACLVQRALQERAAGGLVASRDLLREALIMWRGTPWEDLGEIPALRAETARLREQRVAAFEELFNAELTLGRHIETVSEVAALVEEYPLRERLRAQLMLALHRGGRRAEALVAYDTGRRLLADELGIDPGRALRELHTSILHDLPGLATPGQEQRPLRNVGAVSLSGHTW